MERIYMDHAATTPLRPEALEAMLPYLQSEFGNPSTLYREGQRARRAIEEARETVAGLLGCTPREVIFTSGGSEANNLALKGVAAAYREKGRHIITSAIEHHAVLHTTEALAKNGFEITVLPVDSEGLVSPESVRQALRQDTILVSIMHANNEVGTIQPVAEIGSIVRQHGAYFHTDAVQTAGHIPVGLDELNCDLMSLSAHKFYGPKGVGALIVRRGTRLQQQIHGGHQEQGRRSGTENVAGIVGLATALKLAVAEQDQVNARLSRLRDRLLEEIPRVIPHVRVTGSLKHRLPNNASFCFEFVEGESVLLNLDMKGVAAASGSACTTGSLEPSHVLTAMGIPPEIGHGSLRLSLGKDNTDAHVDYLLEVLPPIIDKLRAMSALYDGASNGSTQTR